MKIAILGFGTVGKGTYETICSAPDCGVQVKKILDLFVPAGFEGVVTTNYQEILDDPEIELVAECMGGLHPAYEFVEAALKAGKHVTSSNKFLICTYYLPLHKLAAEKGVELRFTPAVGGGIPWLFNLRRTKRCDTITSFRGIVNGTTNFILDEMQLNGTDYDTVLKEAQRLGYAEKDPTADVDGLDARRKCAITASVAFDRVLGEENVPTFGIRNVKMQDVAHFREMGRVCRLLASAENQNGLISAYVEPTLVEEKELEAAIHESFNCITLEAKNAGTLRFIGAGAGKMPTGSSLAEDAIDIAQGWGKTPVVLTPADAEAPKAAHAYYIRTAAAVPAEYVEKDFGDGAYLTGIISVATAHELADALVKEDAGSFFAGIRA